MIFTIFTPTFNRAHTLYRVYESLCLQTFKDFEWVVVDDGSEDNTEELIKNWKQNSSFPIIYYKQENKGKHIAINEGVKLASGELFLIADSDDSFFSDALMIFYHEWMGISETIRNDFSGVTGLCISENGKIIGDKYPSDRLDSTPAETFYKYGIKGEKWGFNRTIVLKEYCFPDMGEAIIYPEGLIWNKIGKKYLTRYINIPVRLYYYDSGNQLTNLPLNRKLHMRLFYTQFINEDSEYLLRAPLIFLKYAAQGARYSFHEGDRFKIQFGRLTKLRCKLLWLIATPLGFMLFLIDKVRLR